MRNVLIAAIASLFPIAALSAPVTLAQKEAIDSSVTEWLAQTGAPSASIAVVSDDQIAYVKAYGSARLDPATPATVDTRYAIDSMSKEFSASAMLLLQEEGKLSLDDKVAKYFPQLTSADKITIRQLLSHTSGYPDYTAQDYLRAEMRRPIARSVLLRRWGTKPLTFEPGTNWQYSNTGYVIADEIFAKVAGEPIFPFLQSHIFLPLQMKQAVFSETGNMPPTVAAGYVRYANGPIRPAPVVGTGWYTMPGVLAMTPSDIARWDISLMKRSLLKPQSYDALYTSTKLKNGADTNYSLGHMVWTNKGRVGIGHGGSGPGSSSENRAWPSEKVAIVALTNNSWAGASEVVERVAYVMLPLVPPEAQAREILEDFQKGTVDRTIFTADANAFLTPAVLADQKAGLAPFGPARSFTIIGEADRGGMHLVGYKIGMSRGTLNAVELIKPDGKIEEFVISKAE